MLGGLSVPLSWGVAVPPDDYDHWAPAPEDGADVDVQAAEGADAEAAAMDEWETSGMSGRRGTSGWRRTLNPALRCHGVAAA